MPTHQSVREYTQERIAIFRAIMRSKGFIPDKATRQSAMIHYRFTKGNHYLELSGWHGTGSPIGPVAPLRGRVVGV